MWVLTGHAPCASLCTWFTTHMNSRMKAMKVLIKTTKWLGCSVLSRKDPNFHTRSNHVGSKLKGGGGRVQINLSQVHKETILSILTKTQCLVRHHVISEGYGSPALLKWLSHSMRPLEDRICDTPHDQYHVQIHFTMFIGKTSRTFSTGDSRIESWGDVVK